MKKKLVYFWVIVAISTFLLGMVGVFYVQKTLSVSRFLVLRLGNSPITFNPVMCKDISSARISSLLFLGLVKYDYDGIHLKPALAKSYQVLDDGKRWRFFLRENLFWSDGHPITAKDVKFTFNNFIFNPKVPSPLKGMFIINGKKIVVKVVSDKIVDFILPSPYSPFLSLMTVGILPRHKLMRLSPDSLASAYGISDVANIVSSGPFVIEKYVENEMVILKKNKFYYLNKYPDFLPKLEKIVFLIVRSSDTAILKFLDKQIDILALRPEDVFLLKGWKKKSGFSVKMVSAGIPNSRLFLCFNQRSDANILGYKREWFKDIRFRKAVNLAIDRQSIINAVYYGLGKSVLDGGSRDIRQAKRLLLEMGFKDIDSDGILEDGAGRKLEFTLVVGSNSTVAVNIAQIIAANLLDVGIKVKVAPIDFNRLVSMLTSQFDWEMAVVGISVEGDPYFYSQMWKSDGNLHFWDDEKEIDPVQKEIDNLFAKIAKCFDEEEKTSLISQWQRLAVETYDVIYLPVPQVWLAVSDRVSNVKIESGGKVNLEQIEVEGGRL